MYKIVQGEFCGALAFAQLLWKFDDIIWKPPCAHVKWKWYCVDTPNACSQIQPLFVVIRGTHNYSGLLPFTQVTRLDGPWTQIDWKCRYWTREILHRFRVLMHLNATFFPHNEREKVIVVFLLALTLSSKFLEFDKKVTKFIRVIWPFTIHHTRRWKKSLWQQVIQKRQSKFTL